MLSRTMRLSRAHFAPSGPEIRLSSPHFSLSLRRDQAHGGLAAVVAKKVAKLSVSRHLLKRRMLAVMRPYYRPDRALIAYARPGAPALPFQALKEELDELLARAAAR